MPTNLEAFYFSMLLGRGQPEVRDIDCQVSFVASWGWLFAQELDGDFGHAALWILTNVDGVLAVAVSG